MSTVLDIKKAMASYLGREAVNELNPINMPTPGVGIDLGLLALNNARRAAENAHDFKYAETNVFLSIGTNGSPLSSSYVNSSVTVTGTLSPNVTGAFALAGLYNNQPFYTRTVSSVVYFLSYSGTAWTVTAGGFTIGSDYWILTTARTNPSGTYAAHGAYTGTLTAAIATASLGVKRVKYVSLPIASGDYEVIEFLTNDQFLSRVRMQTGRQSFNAIKTLSMLGATGLVNPLAYQNAQTIYLSGQYATLPIVAQLSVVQWLPDYLTDTDSDFFTQYSPEYLQWQGLVELNNLYRRFAPKEGSIDVTEITGLAAAAMQQLLAWDMSTIRGTSSYPPATVNG